MLNVFQRKNPLGYSFVHTTNDGIINLHSLTQNQNDKTLTTFIRGHEEGEILVDYLKRSDLLLHSLFTKGYTLTLPFSQLDKEEKADIGGVVALLNSGLNHITIMDSFKNIKDPYINRVRGSINKVVPHF